MKKAPLILHFDLNNLSKKYSLDEKQLNIKGTKGLGGQKVEIQFFSRSKLLFIQNTVNILE